MFNGKMKAVTFSFDDGVRQDIKLIELLDKYGLKCTFNLNSGNFSNNGRAPFEGKMIERGTVDKDMVKSIYANHEVAVHTVSHPNLTTLTEPDIIKQVGEDKLALSELVGYEVRGMAYPCGGVNSDERVAAVVKGCGIDYARTIISTHNFDVQDNLLLFNPTVYIREREKMFELAREFVELKPTTPKILYIWGHAYELDYGDDGWETIEELFKIISNKEDIFYGTNSQVLLAK